MKGASRAVGHSVCSVLACVVAGSSASAETTADGALIGVREYAFPAYEEAWGYTRVDGTTDSISKYWSEREYVEAIEDPRFEFEKLIYSSDGFRVVTYVYRPSDADHAPLPAIVFNRGSGVHGDLAPVLIPLLRRYAVHGFVVFAPMYRESDGGEGDDANGGDDLHDLMNMAPLIESLPYVDRHNLFLAGESRGAMMTFQALREGFPARAAAVWGAFSDLGELFEAAPEIVEYGRAEWPGFEADNPENDIRQRSVIFWPEAIRVPLLIMHGESDGAVPPRHSLNLALQLSELGRVYSLIIFAEDGHILANNQVERDARVIEWFRRYGTAGEAELLERLRTSATEAEINRFGNQQARRGNIELAMRAFRLNAERFPDSMNVHDSLGEALAHIGDLPGAIQSYRRALEMASDDTHRQRIRAIIEELERRDSSSEP